MSTPDTPAVPASVPDGKSDPTAESTKSNGASRVRRMPPPPTTAASQPADTQTASDQPRFWERNKRYVWQGKVFPAFWTVTGILSLIVNVILIAILLGLGRYLFTLKNLIGDQVLGGLTKNFVLMDDAHIETTILVDDTITYNGSIPVVFDLVLNQDTTVVLTKDTPVPNTMIYLNGAAVPVNIVLPEGTPLDINLAMTIPVNKEIPVTLQVPVKLTVPVDIALNQTELHQPFVGLRDVVQPYYGLLAELPRSLEETPLCGKLTTPLCRWFEK